MTRRNLEAPANGVSATGTSEKPKRMKLADFDETVRSTYQNLRDALKSEGDASKVVGLYYELRTPVLQILNGDVDRLPVVFEKALVGARKVVDQHSAPVSSTIAAIPVPVTVEDNEEDAFASLADNDHG